MQQQLLEKGLQQGGGSLAGHSIVSLIEDPGTLVLYVILGLAGLAYLFTYLLEIEMPRQCALHL